MKATLKFELVNQPQWEIMDGLPDRTVFQTKTWLDFISESQMAKPIVAAIREGGEEVGWFTGLIVSKFGLKILGSPFPGWSTSYMGFNLKPDISRIQAVKGLADFAFSGLGCSHFEMMDRHIEEQDVKSMSYTYRQYRGFEIDLTISEDQLFKNMTSACRRCIRKSEREGVIIEEAKGSEFADDYYGQLKEVFGRQTLIPTYSIERVRSLIKHVHPTGNLLLLRARDRNGHCIATSIFPAMNGTMYFWGGASQRKYQILRPNEAIQWYAMRYWREKGIARYDMGGAGEYKRKYGGKEIVVPWLRKSRYAHISILRNFAKLAFNIRQRLSGKFANRDSFDEYQ